MTALSNYFLHGKNEELSFIADVKLSHGRQGGQTCCNMGITEQTYYSWRKEYGGMKTVQVKRLKDLERENGRLKKPDIKEIPEITALVKILLFHIIHYMRQFYGTLNSKVGWHWAQ